jgi:hypothetical protein
MFVMCALAPSMARAASTVNVNQFAALVADADEKSVVDFKGMGFGVGIGFSKDVGKGKIVQEAQVINGFVRVTDSRRDIPRLVLESHYFWVAKKPAHWGWGPYVAVQTGSNEIMESIGAGLMLGLRRAKIEVPVTSDSNGDQQVGEPKVNTDSFNVGVGAILDSHSKVFRSGVQEDAAIPAGEEGSPLTRVTSRWGASLRVSLSF